MNNRLAIMALMSSPGLAAVVAMVWLLALTVPACDEIKTSDADLVSVGETRVAEGIDDPATVIIDVRRSERYAEGHIPTAINIFLPDLRARDPRLAEAQRIIVYGRGWTDPLSSAAAKRLIALGYTNVQDFRGGVELWRDAGFELVTADADAEANADVDAQADEWIVLFDGGTFDGWRGFGREDVPEGWAVDEEERAIQFTHGEGDINLGLITQREFDNFELVFEWKVAPGANSGVFFRVAEDDEAIWHTGPEYQVVDNEEHPDGDDPLTAAASNYALHGPEEDHTRPAGEYNQGRLIVRGKQVEHWLNGQQVLAYELESQAWEQLVEETAFAEWPAYGRVGRGHIALQESVGGPVWYRNIRLRPLD